MPRCGAGRSARLPGWMSGCWQQVEGERWSEECWTIDRHGSMLGSGRTGDTAKVRSFEFMRIERGPNGLVFHGGPGGQGWTPFPQAPDSEGGVTFLNAEHDYPQRIRYWREGDLLKAEVSLADGSQSQTWTYGRMGG
ncbi:DUF6265 family protein [Croceibacterium salegens]|uniref:DUF6265 family protein n=1 Tax=Croceibacterium salegens TaxID=1737568 RepID=UPI002E256BE3